MINCCLMPNHQQRCYRCAEVSLEVRSANTPSSRRDAAAPIPPDVEDSARQSESEMCACGRKRRSGTESRCARADGRVSWCQTLGSDLELVPRARCGVCDF